jgi:hypothetical protein
MINPRHLKDLALFYGLYTYTIFNLDQQPPLLSINNEITYTSESNNEFYLDFNNNANECLTSDTECNPEHCYTASKCVPRKCDPPSKTCLRQKITFPLKPTTYKNIYVHSNFDGSKWNLHKIIPFHLTSSEDYDENQLYYIFIFTHPLLPTVVCFPPDSIIIPEIYSIDYELIEKRKYHYIVTKGINRLDEVGIINEIIEQGKDKEYLFCGHSMGCVLSQTMILNDWKQLEHYKSKCRVVCSGGYSYFNEQEVFDLTNKYHVQSYIYGSDKYNNGEVVVDSYMNKSPSKKIPVTNRPINMLLNGEIISTQTSELKTCGSEKVNYLSLSVIMHEWKAYKNEIYRVLKASNYILPKGTRKTRSTIVRSKKSNSKKMGKSKKFHTI